MPGPTIGKPSLFPDWVKPENASVFDPPYRTPLRWLVKTLGLDDPNSAMMLGTPMELPSEELGGALGYLAKKLPRLAKAIKAYHGSPHDFEQFTSEKIGTGEGMQAYGHGLYFAEHPEVARQYQKDLIQRPITLTGDAPLTYEQSAILKGLREGNIPIDDPAIERSVGDIMLADPKPKPRTTATHQKWQQAWQALKPRLSQVEQPGRMYEVNIHADPEHFLDWDKPLSEQSPHIQQAMERAPIPMRDRWKETGAWPNVRGRELYDQVVGATKKPGPTRDWGMVPDQAAATIKLREAGIPGIKYLDQVSRGAGEGTRNYVVFDDKTIEILRKYGILLPAAGLGAAAHGITQPQKPD